MYGVEFDVGVALRVGVVLIALSTTLDSVGFAALLVGRSRDALVSGFGPPMPPPPRHARPEP